MFGRFEYMTNLQYKVKNQQHELDLFRSGEKYIQMESGYRAVYDGMNREIERLKAELAAARAETITVRGYWFEVFEDIQAEHAKEMRKQERIVDIFETRALKAERLADELKDENLKLKQERYAALTELEEERGKNQKLTAQINKNYENSSIPSSQKPNRKKISNNREKSGKKPGGQPGHEGHGRKRQEPTSVIEIPPPEEYMNNPDYELTGIEKRRQKVGIKVVLNVEE